MSVYLQRCKKTIGENNYRKFAQWLKKQELLLYYLHKSAWKCTE